MDVRFHRDIILSQVVKETKPWDILIIGGGATGLSIALDASSRGFRTLLLEREDFASETSSKSTKLIHGGIRYLQKGQFSLVREALQERNYFWQNAPHLVSQQEFFIPSFHYFESPFYYLGLKMYDLLAGSLQTNRAHYIPRKESRSLFSSLHYHRLKGGTIFTDGQCDDARLAITIAKTAHDHGAQLLNYMYVTDFIKSSNKIIGVKALDRETRNEHEFFAKVIINATGPFTDRLRQKDEPSTEKVITPSLGTHLVVSKKFLPGNCGIVVPHTSDHRIVFLIPWEGKVLIGTTDTPAKETEFSPKPSAEDREFLLMQVNRYLHTPIQPEDILSAFTGIRPLAKSPSTKGTRAISREHQLELSPSGLINIFGGKWTTARKMAEDTLSFAIEKFNLPHSPCITKEIRLHGYHPLFKEEDPLKKYGTDQGELLKLLDEDIDYKELLDPEFPYLCGEVIWAVRHEMARTLIDVLTRRLRILFLDQKKALAMAPLVVSLMAKEMKKGVEWEEKELSSFREAAKKFTFDL